MRRCSNAKAASTEPQISKPEDQFENELERVREGQDELDKAAFSQEGFLSYLDYAKKQREALRQDYREKSRNMEGRLSRVKDRLLKVNKAGVSRGSTKQIEMTENPLKPLPSADLPEI